MNTANSYLKVDFSPKEQAFQAYWYLLNNHDWAIKGMMVEVVKLNPEGEQDSDGEIHYWIEGGPFKKTDIGGHYLHDMNLDSEGKTFEEALIDYKNKVIQHYED